ncbi:MAG TPA: hypothetical protein VG105_20980 [Paraburkholderia sp.]|jgi:hypothetical protein|nr:hypothetical protein [Paraburkholderia sp.]
MWVRAVTVALLAAACCAATAQAAQYTEVWNPPEVRHAPKHVKTAAPSGRKVAAKRVSAGKGKLQPVSPKKVSLHAEGKTKPRLKVATKTAPKKPIKMAQVQTRAGHVHLAAHPKGQTVAARPASAQRTLKVANAAARHAPAHPAAAMTSVAAKPASAHPAATMASAATRPAADSRDLPPILH